MYYYLISSLPLLHFAQRPPFSVADYLFSCQGVLTPEDLSELKALLQNDKSRIVSSFGKDWQSWMAVLGNSVLKLRAAGIGLDVRASLLNEEKYSVDLQQGVSFAFSRDNPLERELALDQLKWAIIEELSVNQSFTVDAVYAYGLELQILERWHQMSQKIGESKLEDLLSSATNLYSSN